ncbi:MAG: hypothetical protein HYX67_04800 [Candidatus Melainabacteria bacterium]|nr:hypothetical protein [Candidatus Melainabacteria bacterium]
MANYEQRHIWFDDDVLTGRSHSCDFGEKDTHPIVGDHVQVNPEMLSGVTG